MKKLTVLLTFLSLAIFPNFVLAADEPVTVSGNTEVAAPAEQTAPVEVGNKICPISGEKIGEMGDVVKQEYKGKIYNLCCPMCIKDFNKDPEKYAKIADDEVSAAAAAGEQVAAPADAMPSEATGDMQK